MILCPRTLAANPMEKYKFEKRCRDMSVGDSPCDTCSRDCNRYFRKAEDGSFIEYAAHVKPAKADKAKKG